MHVGFAPHIDRHAVQAAAANSATAGMEAATAKKMLAEFQSAIVKQVASLEQRLGVDAAELAKVMTLLPACIQLLLHIQCIGLVMGIYRLDTEYTTHLPCRQHVQHCYCTYFI